MTDEVSRHLTGATIRGASIQRPYEEPRDPSSAYLEIELTLADGRDANLWVAVELPDAEGWRDVDPGLTLKLDLVRTGPQFESGAEPIAEHAEPLYGGGETETVVGQLRSGLN